MSNPRPNPYVGPRSFETHETLYGRARELRMLSAQLISERVVLLHSPSGAGKTSLIQAGLVPLLRQENFHVLPLARVNLDSYWKATPGFNRYTFSVIAALEEGLPEGNRRPLASLAGLTLDAYLTGRPRPADAPRSDLLLFDQFEEILTVAPTDQAGKQAFFTQLGAALRNPARWALFAMREDYLGALAPYVRPLPNRFEATFRLDLLGVDAALQAIQSPAQAAGVTFSDEAAHKLADDLRRTQVQQVDGSLEAMLGPHIEPVQLQVVCYRLWQSLDAEAISIDRADTDAVGNVDQSLAEYYALSVETAASETGLDERSIREWFENKLITKEGLRGQVLFGAEQSDGLDNRAIRLLENAHLLRAEKRAGATWFELSHDRLLGPVKKDNAAWFEKHLSLLQKQAKLWIEQGRGEGLLLRGKELNDAEAGLGTIELTPDEQTFLEICRTVRKREQHERQQTQREFIITMLATIAGILLTATLLMWNARESLITEQKSDGEALARMLASTSYIVRDLPNEVERGVADQMVTEATITAHFVAAAEAAGWPPEEINKHLKEITSNSSLSEIRVTDSKGHVYLQNQDAPDFTFSADPVKQPQSSIFYSLLTGKSKVVIQPVFTREDDGKIFKYVAVTGVDKPRIVQVGFEAIALNLIRQRVGIDRLGKELVDNGDLRAIRIVNNAVQTNIFQAAPGIDDDLSAQDLAIVKQVIAQGKAQTYIDDELLKVVEPIHGLNAYGELNSTTSGAIILFLPTDRLNTAITIQLSQAFTIVILAVFIGASVTILQVLLKRKREFSIYPKIN